MDLKARLEFQSKTKVGKAELAEYYGQIKYAATSEKVSATFVEISMMLHNSVFKNAECTRLCMWFDELNEKNPLDSIYKIRSIVIGVDKKIPDFIWCMQMLWDWWQRTCKGEEITNRLLNGESSGWNGKSILDLFLYKRSLRNNLWRRMEKYSWADAIKTKIKEVTEDIQMCRACLGFVHNNKEFGDVDTTFRGSWPASASSFLLCLESLTFAYSDDDTMKTCMKIAGQLTTSWSTATSTISSRSSTPNMQKRQIQMARKTQTATTRKTTSRSTNMLTKTMSHQRFRNTQTC